MDVSVLDRPPQGGAGREQALLPDELVERARPHPRRERLRPAEVLIMGLLEEVDGSRSEFRQISGTSNS